MKFNERDQPMKTAQQTDQPWSFFFRVERNAKALKGLTFEEFWNQKGALGETFVLPSDLTLDEAIEEAIENGCPRGSHRSGIFEVQNSTGVWKHINRKKILGSKKVIFTTWDEIEAEEEGCTEMKHKLTPSQKNSLFMIKRFGIQSVKNGREKKSLEALLKKGIVKINNRGHAIVNKDLIQ